MPASTQTFYDEDTGTLSYVVFDRDSKDAIVIDPVLNYTSVGSICSLTSVDALDAFLKREELNLGLILETHAHADHLSGARYLQARYPKAPVAIGGRIGDVQALFKDILNLPKRFATDGSQFDRVIEAGEIVEVGTLSFKGISTPGHTPACMSYLVEDALFVGDAIFLPDVGTGRCDFPGGSAPDLYKTITEKIFAMPEETKIFVAHDYPKEGRSWQCQTTVGIEKAENIHLNSDTSEASFVDFRQSRDAGLKAPRLLWQSIQVNLNGGYLPQAESNGSSYLKIPLTAPKLG